jgi:hypothetical protein
MNEIVRRGMEAFWFAAGRSFEAVSDFCYARGNRWLKRVPLTGIRVVETDLSEHVPRVAYGAVIVRNAEEFERAFRAPERPEEID